MTRMAYVGCFSDDKPSDEYYEENVDYENEYPMPQARRAFVQTDEDWPDAVEPELVSTVEDLLDGREDWQDIAGFSKLAWDKFLSKHHMFLMDVRAGMWA